MNRQSYLKRFSCAARWCLSGKEAEEVISDYKTMLEDRPESGDLTEELGKPFHAARLLTARTAYCRWLAVFGLLVCCLLLPEYLLLRGMFYRSSFWLLAVLLAAGVGGSLVYFRPQPGEQKGPLPKGLLPMMGVTLFALLAAGAVLLSMVAGIGGGLPLRWYGLIARWTLNLAGTAAAMLGLWGLAQARMADRRWCALYVLGLTALIVCALVLSMLTNMEMPVSGWWKTYALRNGGVILLGLVGAGVSLC
jgi:hypothetical protein